MTVYEWMMMMRISSNRYSRCRNMLHRNVTIQSVHWGYCSSVTAVSCHGNHYHHHHHHNWNTDASSLLQMYYGVSVPPVVVRTDNNMSISRIPDVKHSLTQPGHHDSMRVVSTNRSSILQKRLQQYGKNTNGTTQLLLSSYDRIAYSMKLSAERR